MSTAINCEDFLQTTAPDEPKKYIDADKIHDVIASHFCACSGETEAVLHSVWDELKEIPGGGGCGGGSKVSGVQIFC